MSHVVDLSHFVGNNQQVEQKMNDLEQDVCESFDQWTGGNRRGKTDWSDFLHAMATTGFAIAFAFAFAFAWPKIKVDKRTASA